MKYLLNQWHETQSQQTLGWPVNSTAKPENHFKTWKTRKQVEDNWNRRTRTLWFIRLPGQWPNGVCLFRQSAIPPRTFPCVTRGPKVLTLPRSPKRPKQQTRVTHSAQFVKNKSTKIAYIVRSDFASFRWKNWMSDVMSFASFVPRHPRRAEQDKKLCKLVQNRPLMTAEVGRKWHQSIAEKTFYKFTFERGAIRRSARPQRSAGSARHLSAASATIEFRDWTLHRIESEPKDQS